MNHFTRRCTLALAACGCLVLIGCPRAEKKADKDASFQGKTLDGWLGQLKRKDEDARLKAAEDLGEVKPDDPGRNIGLLALAQALKDEGKSVREKAAESLRGYGSDAVPVFLAAIKDDDAVVRRNAAAGLAAMWERPGWPRRGIIPERPSEEAAEPAIPLLAGLLKDKDREVRWSAARALVGIGPPALPTLLQGVTSGDRQTREIIVNLLSRTSPPVRKAVSALIEVLRDTKNTGEYLRIQVVSVLGQMGDDAGEALPLLLTLSKSADPDGVAAGQAVQRIRKVPRSTAPALIKLLKDPEPPLRLKAAEVLCELEEGDKECLAALQELVKWRDSKVRQQAARLLHRYGSAAKDAVPALIEIIRTDTDPQTRQAALGVLGVVDPTARKAAIPALIEVVRNYYEPGTRSYAVGILAGMGPDAKAAVPTLKAVLAEVSKPGTPARGRAWQDTSVEKAIQAALKKIEP
jgi:HEAT repeat protein